MRFIILFFFLFSGCVSSLQTEKQSNQTFGLLTKADVNSSVIKSHPEYPIVASPFNPAWEIALYLGLGITFFCALPSILVYICERWKPFWCVDPDNKKDLTEEEG